MLAVHDRFLLVLEIWVCWLAFVRMAAGIVDDHFENIRRRLGRSASRLEVRLRALSFCCLMSCQVHLVDYVDRLVNRSAVSFGRENIVFDNRVLDKLMFAPRIVQAAILENARHAGLAKNRFPGSLRRACAVSRIRNPSAFLHSSLSRMIDIHKARGDFDAEQIVPCGADLSQALSVMTRLQPLGRC